MHYVMFFATHLSASHENHLQLCYAAQTREHFLQLLSGPKKDPDANNATILLKALQKTIVFEKETCAWLPREFGTVFISANTEASDVANSASTVDGAASTEQAPVESLLGVASVAFEKFMGPYIALEDQSMDELLINAVDDKTVDNRGEMPVFTSSTKLFVYIKGSIARCNAMSKGHAFFLLYEAFQGSIRASVERETASTANLNDWGIGWPQPAGVWYCRKAAGERKHLLDLPHSSRRRNDCLLCGQYL
jgi:Vps53-like, N-terminal